MSDVLQLADGSTVALDEHGFLAKREQWTPEVAVAFATRDGTSLSAAHWQVLEVLRDWFDEYQGEPPMRALLQRLKQRSNNPDYGSRDLYRLFPDHPVREGSRYAGLPIPLSCI